MPKSTDATAQDVFNHAVNNGLKEPSAILELIQAIEQNLPIQERDIGVRNRQAKSYLLNLAMDLVDLHKVASEKYNAPDSTPLGIINNEIGNSGLNVCNQASALATSYLNNFSSMSDKEKEQTAMKIKEVSNCVNTLRQNIVNPSPRNLNNYTKQIKDSCQFIKPEKGFAKKLFKGLAIAGCVLFTASCVAAAIPTLGASLPLLAVPATALMTSLNAAPIGATAVTIGSVVGGMAMRAGFGLLFEPSSSTPSQQHQESLGKHEAKALQRSEASFSNTIIEISNSINSANKELCAVTKDMAQTNQYKPDNARQSRDSIKEYNPEESTQMRHR